MAEDAAPHPAVQGIILERHNLEFALARAALNRSMPILGVCRGMQLLNVVAGGTICPILLMNLQMCSSRRHTFRSNGSRGPDRAQFAPVAGLWRAVIVIPDNSMHHQAIKQLAPEFVVSARANDGVVEAIEAPGRPFVIGVQWHPEWMYVSEPACSHLIDNFVKGVQFD